ncbi:MAG TPA: hypothetical protein VF743_10740, partial [Acidimicrobiales bacterium]
IPVLGGILNAGLPDGVATPARVAAALSAVFLAAVPVGLASVACAARLRDRPLREEALGLARERVLVQTAMSAAPRQREEST